MYLLELSRPLGGNKEWSHGLEGVALFLGYMSPDFERAGYEYVLMPGKVAFDCISYVIDREKTFPQLCHAALFSHTERVRKRQATGVK